MKCLHLIGPQPYFTNCFLIISDNKNAVAIDPNASFENYEKALEENDATLCAIFLTHGHHDHVGTINQLKQKYKDVKVYMHEQDDMQFSIGADEYFEDEKTYTIDNLDFKVMHTPGHTRGSVCIRLDDLLFTGDTLFNSSIGRCDLEGGDFATMQKTLRKICDKVTDNPQVLPGHEAFSDMETEKRDNPYLQF